MESADAFELVQLQLATVERRLEQVETALTAQTTVLGSLGVAASTIAAELAEMRQLGAWRFVRGRRRGLPD